MTGTDIKLVDGNTAHDHVYYGFGCNNGWGTDGDGGSLVSCDLKYITTLDGESQSMGADYNFQAATAGSGSALSADNAIAPDSFCPLGWQLPYSGAGGDYYDASKSWRYLFGQYGIPVTAVVDVPGATKLRSYPISQVLGGYYRWYAGRLYFTTVQGYNHSSTNKGDYGHSARIVFSKTGYLLFNDTAGKMDGDAIRYVSGLAT